MKTYLLFRTSVGFFLIGIFPLLFYACDNDDAPKTLPIVITSSAFTDITTTSATGGGTISSNGNTTITAAGLVYSNIVAQPTLSDGKTVETVTSGPFTSKISGLSSGKTYHVRAYATNEVGTAYGEVIDFMTGNAAPTADNLIVTGTAEVNKTLTVTYSYTDAESDTQGATTFQWYMADNSTGSNETAIPGATASTFLIQQGQQGKFIRVGVTPKAATGTIAGTEAKSAFQTAVGEATTVTFQYNGAAVTYGIIVSGKTQERWLDRNLGASNSPSSATDVTNYGDLFQWGRAADGHQVVLRNGPNDGDMVGANGITSATTPFEYSSTATPPHNKFIVVDGDNGPFDWLSSINNNLWQGVGGLNNPCPSGWRIPTSDEWAAEGSAFGTTLNDAFTALKITYTGGRDGTTGDFFQTSSLASYWTSTVDPTDSERIMRVRVIGGVGISISGTSVRANGFACRCIKD
jgi:uncharacterized protein (TIGR02145 family)